MPLESMTFKAFALIFLGGFIGVSIAQEPLSISEYKYPTKRNHVVQVSREGTGWRVQVEFDRINSKRPAVARAIQTTEAEQYLILSICQHFKVGRDHLRLSGLTTSEMDDRSDRFKAVYSVSSVELLSKSIQSSSSGDDPRRDENQSASVLPSGGTSGNTPLAGSPSRFVEAVEISKDLAGKLRKMPTRLSEAPQEVISSASSTANLLSRNWPKRLIRGTAVAVISEMSNELDEVASHFEKAVDMDTRILTLDKPKVKRSLVDALEPFYESLGKIPMTE